MDKQQAISAAAPPSLSLDDLTEISDQLFDTAEPMFKEAEMNSNRTRTSKSGNPLLKVVNQTGIFDMEILLCICVNKPLMDQQLLQAGLFPSSFKQTETAFTFSVLDDFLIDNLECKTTAQQYYSKLQMITNRMFPDSVPVFFPHCIRICLPCSLGVIELVQTNA